MNEEGGQESPKPALHQVLGAENEVLLGKLGVLLPGPEAGQDTSDYEKGVDPQGGPSFPELTRFSRMKTENILTTKIPARRSRNHVGVTRAKAQSMS
jgi:hypothetical protein